MPRVHFTPNLNRHLDCPVEEVTGETVMQALQNVFERNARLRSYIVDDQGRLRQHVTVFLNGRMVRDKLRLSDEVEEKTEIFVMQALSGG